MKEIHHGEHGEHGEKIKNICSYALSSLRALRGGNPHSFRIAFRQFARQLQLDDLHEFFGIDGL
jgi:hypothetical protein